MTFEVKLLITFVATDPWSFWQSLVKIALSMWQKKQIVRKKERKKESKLGGIPSNLIIQQVPQSINIRLAYWFKMLIKLIDWTVMFGGIIYLFIFFFVQDHYQRMRFLRRKKTRQRNFYKLPKLKSVSRACHQPTPTRERMCSHAEKRKGIRQFLLSSSGKRKITAPGLGRYSTLWMYLMVIQLTHWPKWSGCPNRHLTVAAFCGITCLGMIH